MSQFVPNYIPLIGLDPVGAFYVGMPTPSGDAATDTINFNNLLASLPSSGGVIRFQPGNYQTTGNHTCSVPVTIVGAGSGAIGQLTNGGTNYDEAVTKITCTGANVPWLTVNANDCTFRDFRLTNTTATSTSTSSAGIVVATKGIGTLYENILVDGFYINVDHRNGRYWRMIRCNLQSPWFAGLKIQDLDNADEGDMFIADNVFTAGTLAQTPSAAVLWLSAGGFKFINNKINAGPKAVSGTDYNVFKYGVWMQPSGNTTEITYGHNSFGAVTTYGVYLDFSTATSKTVGKVILSNNNGLRIPNAGATSINEKPSRVANSFLLYVRGNTSCVAQNVILQGNNTTYMGLAHLENSRSVILGINSAADGAPGTPYIEIGANVTNVNRNAPIVTDDLSTTVGVNNTATYQQVAQDVLVDQAIQYNPSTDEVYTRMQTLNVTGLYSGTVSSISFSADIVTVTMSATHSFLAGDMVYIQGIVSSGGAVGGTLQTLLNNAYHQVLAVPSGTTLILNSPGQATPSDAYTSGGTVAHMGAMVDVLAFNGKSYSIELEINGGQVANTAPISATVKRNVWIQQSGSAQPSMAVLQAYNSDSAMIDPTVNVSAGAAPRIANTQATGGGAVATANSTTNNPIFSVTAGGVGNGIEVAFESVRQANSLGSWATCNAPASATFSISGTTVSVTTTAVHCMNVGNAFTVSGVVPSAYNGTYFVTHCNNNNTFTYIVASNVGAVTQSGTFTRDRYLVSQAGSYNLGLTEARWMIGETVQAVTAISGATITTLSNPSANTARIVTATAHGYTNVATGDWNTAGLLVTVTGASVGAYNVTNAAVTVIDTTTFEFPISGTGLANGTGASYTVTAPARRVAQIVSDNAFLVDQPYPCDFFQKALIPTDVALTYNKLRIYVRPINATGLFSGSVRCRVTGWHSRVAKVAT